MTMELNLLCRVIRRRVENGEKLETVFRDYPRITEEERAEVKSVLSNGAK